MKEIFLNRHNFNVAKEKKCSIKREQYIVPEINLWEMKCFRGIAVNGRMLLRMSYDRREASRGQQDDANPTYKSQGEWRWAMIVYE